MFTFDQFKVTLRSLSFLFLGIYTTLTGFADFVQGHIIPPRHDSFGFLPLPETILLAPRTKGKHKKNRSLKRHQRFLRAVIFLKRI